MEMRNVGSFESPLRVKNELAAEIQVPLMIDICNKYEILYIVLELIEVFK